MNPAKAPVRQYPKAEYPAQCSVFAALNTPVLPFAIRKNRERLGEIMKGIRMTLESEGFEVQTGRYDLSQSQPYPDKEDHPTILSLPMYDLNKDVQGMKLKNVPNVVADIREMLMQFLRAFTKFGAISEDRISGSIIVGTQHTFAKNRIKAPKAALYNRGLTGPSLPTPCCGHSGQASDLIHPKSPEHSLPTHPSNHLAEIIPQEVSQSAVHQVV